MKYLNLFQNDLNKIRSKEISRAFNYLIEIILEQQEALEILSSRLEGVQDDYDILSECILDKTTENQPFFNQTKDQGKLARADECSNGQGDKLR